MKLCRYTDGTQAHTGIVEDDTVYALQGDFFAGPHEKGERVGALADVALLAPVQPGKVICIGRNYAAHIEEMGRTTVTEPLVFYKPPSSVIGPGAAIELLPEMGDVHHEAELAAVIGRRGRFIPQADAFSYVLGCTCGNDVTDRDFQNGDVQWWRAKGFDTFCPLGPWIETTLDPADLALTCRVNGEVRQEARTALMLFDLPALIAFISRAITLEPGDVILTGTPAGVGSLHAGDTVTVEIEGIGALSNPIVTHDV